MHKLIFFLFTLESRTLGTDSLWKTDIVYETNVKTVNVVFTKQY